MNGVKKKTENRSSPIRTAQDATGIANSTHFKAMNDQYNYWLAIEQERYEANLLAMEQDREDEFEVNPVSTNLTPDDEF
jgi:hypothetical protein